MKHSQLNLALLAVAAGLGVAVYFSQEKEEKGAPLTALAKEAISQVRLEHPGAPAIVLEKAGANWQMLEPVKARVDAIEINGVLNLATLETKATLKAADVKLADLGLEPPQYSVVINGQKFEIGNTEPLNYRRYIRSGEQIVLTDDPPSTALDADYSDLVSKQLLPENSEISEIQLPGLRIARAPDGKSWDLAPPTEASADQKQKLVDAWKNARAMWNAQQDGDLPKGEKVTVKFKDQSLDFIVAERDPQIVLVQPELKVRYTLSKALEQDMLQLPAPAAAAAEPAAETALPDAVTN